MVVWSGLCCISRPYLIKNTICFKNIAKDALVQKRMMSGGHGEKMPIQPSRWQWHKFKDLFHYYIMVGAIPITGIIVYANLFIGPAQLAEIPDGYVPKHWEYYKHPITRFLARYVYNNPQQEYEKYLHFMYEEDEKAKIRRLTSNIKEKMAERHDYQAYYYKPVTPKYHKYTKEIADKLEGVRGEN
uniref:NADH dehydrogenase [ubiquinone] 1 beta subcomplex subunit 5, mitochondrial n=1 Tax=Clastoptera arizonana TaxID=38151 RepID=A0A1B6E1R0_9HEMI